MWVTVVWLKQFVRLLTVGSGFIPRAWTGFLESIPMEGYIAHPRHSGESLGSASNWCDRLCWLPMGDLTLSEEWMRGSVWERWGSRRRGGRGNCDCYAKWKRLILNLKSKFKIRNFKSKKKYLANKMALITRHLCIFTSQVSPSLRVSKKYSWGWAKTTVVLKDIGRIRYHSYSDRKNKGFQETNLKVILVFVFVYNSCGNLCVASTQRFKSN